MFTQRRIGRSYGHVIQIKKAFSLRDKIGTCPNIEVEIDVTDKSLFLLGHIMLERKARKLFQLKRKNISRL